MPVLNRSGNNIIRLFCFSVIGLFLSAGPALASITLRVVAVNPSDEIEQKVPIKVYLPVEVKPEDVIAKDDLEIAYDTQQGSYYVSGEYPLKPRETLEREVELKDIWLISGDRIAELRKETGAVFIGFEKTAYAERARLLHKNVEKKIREIEDLQGVAGSLNPAQHISNYRYCLSILDSVQADLLAAKTLLAEVAPQSTARLTWKIIVFIIGFLAVLSLGFFFIWQHQAKIQKSLSQG